MNKILVLGASGLLGHALVELLQTKNYAIGVISREVEYHEDSKIKVYAINILDYDTLASVIKEYDTIINCTGQISNPINECLLTNTKGIENIIKAINNYDKKLIHISSVSVYGTTKYANEETNLNPQTPYGTAKCFSEYLIQSNLSKYTILRVSNLFGLHQQKGIINYLTKSYLSNEADVYFNNDGDLKRYYIHTEDISSIINEVMENSLIGVYNIIGPELLSIKDLVKKFEEILNFKFNVSYTKDKAIENIDLIDNSKINNIIKQEFDIDISKYLTALK